MKKGLLAKLCVCLAVIISCTFVIGGCKEDGNDEPTEPTEYTIQYTDDMGTHTISVETGSLYALEAIPEKTGYEFQGLFDAKTGGTQYVDETGSALSAFTDNKNMVLFPQFKAKEYTLILDYQGAAVTGSRSMTVSYDSIINDLPMNLSLENKEFTGWYTQPNKQGTQIADVYGVLPAYNKVTESTFDLSNADNRIYLYAGFEGVKHTLTLYYENNNNPEEVQVEYGTYISEVVTETRVNGKAVLYWSKTKNDTELTNVFTGKVTGDMVLYAAEYAPVIDFNENGGKEITPIVARAGSVVALPTPTRENYNFVEWQDTSGNAYTATTMPQESITLKAVWQAKLVFDENGGTEVSDISQATGTSVTLPVPEKDGYIFAGWYLGNQAYTATAMPETSFTLRAGWYKIATKKVVVISETNSESIQSVCSPSMDSNYHEVDLSDLYQAGIREIEVTARYQSKGADGTVSAPLYTYMSWYSQRSASDAYKIWSYTDKHEDKDWETYTHMATLPLKAPKIYICRYCGPYSYIYTYYDYPYRWKDFWLEIQYPDMTNLYL